MRSCAAGSLLVFLGLCLAGPPAHAAAISGRVFEDLNANGVFDPGEPCVDAVVSLRLLAGGPEQTAVVQCVGGTPGPYYFGSLPRGEYRVAVKRTLILDAVLPSITVDLSDDAVRLVQRDLPVRRVVPETRPDPQAVDYSIEGVVTATGPAGRAPLPLAGVAVALQDDLDSLSRAATTDAAGRYRFSGLAPGLYRVIVTDLPGAAAGEAVAGPNAKRIDGSTLEVKIVSGTTRYAGNNFVKGVPLEPTTRVERLVAVGDAALPGKLGIFRNDPLAPDQNVSTIRRIARDGSLFVTDHAGTGLFRLKDRQFQNLLDTATCRDPRDGCGLARLVQVETGLDGASAVLALRADNRRAIYRQDGTALIRVGPLWDAAEPVQMTIGDAGQIAYVGRDAASGFQTVFQAAPVAPGAPPPLDQMVHVENREGSLGVSGLQSNGRGELAFTTTRHLQITGETVDEVWRKIGDGQARLVAGFPGFSPPGRGADPNDSTRLVRIRARRRPRIGPEGTVVFMAADTADRPSFVNFFIVRPAGGSSDLLEPVLPGGNWNPDPSTFDYDVATDGTVALRVAPGTSTSSRIALVAPDGALSDLPLTSPSTGRELQPQGRPAFGSNQRLFFLGADPGLPLDRNGHAPVGLYSILLAAGRPMGLPQAVAVYGQSVPGRERTRLLGITQRPGFSVRGQLAFGALFEDDRALAPTPAFFRVPLDGTLESAGVLEAQEGDALPGADRVALFRDLYPTAEQSATATQAPDPQPAFDSFLPGSGSLVDTLSSRGGSSGGFRPADIRPPLLVVGQRLERAEHTLLAVLSQLVAVPPDRQSFLFTAKFARQGDELNGEGLFTVERGNMVQSVALKGTPVPGLDGWRFAGFGDTAAATLNPPTVAADGTVVFKARIEKARIEGERSTGIGVFQWTPGDREPTYVFHVDGTEEDPLTRWAAGPSRSVYFLRRSGGPGTVETRLYGRAAAGIVELATTARPLLVAGKPWQLTDLIDFQVNRFGHVLLQAAGRPQAARGEASGLLTFQTAGQLPVPLIVLDQKIPRSAKGKEYPKLIFDGTFALEPETPSGYFGFYAGVWKRGDPGSHRVALIRLRPDPSTTSGIMETIQVDDPALLGSRRLRASPFIASLSQPEIIARKLLPSRRQQSRDGVTAFATYGEQDGWVIYRSAGGSVTVVAQSGQRLPGGKPIVSLDAGAMLDLPAGSGPLFTLGAHGEVTFLATDGERWGIYRSSPSRALEP
jgi:hypothetical protein